MPPSCNPGREWGRLSLGRRKGFVKKAASFAKNSPWACIERHQSLVSSTVEGREGNPRGTDSLASVVESMSLARTVMKQHISECDFWSVHASAEQNLSLCLHLCGQPYQLIKQIR